MQAWTRSTTKPASKATREYVSKTHQVRDRAGADTKTVRKGGMERLNTDWACEYCGWPGDRGERAFIPADDDFQTFCCGSCATAALMDDLFD